MDSLTGSFGQPYKLGFSAGLRKYGTRLFVYDCTSSVRLATVLVHPVCSIDVRLHHHCTCTPYSEYYASRARVPDIPQESP
jgi:hypothetical protein